MSTAIQRLTHKAWLKASHERPPLQFQNYKHPPVLDRLPKSPQRKIESIIIFNKLNKCLISIIVVFRIASALDAGYIPAGYRMVSAHITSLCTIGVNHPGLLCLRGNIERRFLIGHVKASDCQPEAKDIDWLENFIKTPLYPNY
jgi:hypothetical protein